MSNKTRNNHLLSYPVIVLASDGDVDAINAVLKHYEGYIATLSMRTFYYESGNPHLCVDGPMSILWTQKVELFLSV